MSYSEHPPVSLNGSDTTSPPDGAIVESIVPEAPRPLSREIPKGEIYPVEALGPIKEAVAAVHDKTQAPIAIAAQSALAVASLAVQGFADVETLGGPAPCSLYCLTVAQSGERKSACDRFLMKAVREHETDAAKAHKKDWAAYDTEQKIWEARRTRLLKEAAGSNGIKAVEARADLDNLDTSPEPPLSPNKTATDPTFEGLVKLFAIGQPALGLFTDEAGAFLGGHAMNSDNRLKTCAGLSGLWDGTPINRSYRDHRRAGRPKKFSQLICERVHSIDIRKLVKCGGEYSRPLNPITGQHEAIQTTSTPCYLGGSRLWFLCPQCHSRCAILYANKNYLCRKCHGLRYSVELNSLEDRAIARCIRFRERYGLKEGGTVAPFPAKPKLMRWHTYFKARETDKRLRERAFAFTAQNLSHQYPQ